MGSASGGDVQFGEREEAGVAQPRQNPPLDDENRRFDLGYAETCEIATRSRPTAAVARPIQSAPIGRAPVPELLLLIVALGPKTDLGGEVMPVLMPILLMWNPRFGAPLGLLASWVKPKSTTTMPTRIKRAFADI
jgi:hypothetical protein